MRTVVALSLALALTTSAAFGDEPKGIIGVQLKVAEGKITVIGTIGDSPAEKAGVKVDDVLLKVNDFAVSEKAEQDDLTATVTEIGKYEPGAKIKLTVKRGDKEMVIEVTVGKRE
jgi:carboxyl-terminal processing protease